jgi:ethanolamine ammonia-lyase small subunit
MADNNQFIVANPWLALRQLTAARIALGRTGASLPTGPQLDFQLAHARARDAVHVGLDVLQLLQALRATAPNAAHDCLELASAAKDRLTYLQRPDLGRRLSEASRAQLTARTQASCSRPADDSTLDFDLAVVLADGLSARAVMQNVPPLLAALWPRLAAQGGSLAPVSVVTQARVAIGDEIGQLLRARLVVVLIGERPGLSSPDSLGAYLTWTPRVGLTDESRNCVSNIRPAGLAFEAAADQIDALVSAMRQRQLSGVGLKAESLGTAIRDQSPGRLPADPGAGRKA